MVLEDGISMQTTYVSVRLEGVRACVAAAGRGSRREWVGRKQTLLAQVPRVSRN